MNENNNYNRSKCHHIGTMFWTVQVEHKVMPSIGNMQLDTTRSIFFASKPVSMVSSIELALRLCGPNAE